jgi:hypothetical protein
VKAQSSPARFTFVLSRFSCPVSEDPNVNADHGVVQEPLVMVVGESLEVDPETPEKMVVVRMKDATARPEASNRRVSNWTKVFV